MRNHMRLILGKYTEFSVGNNKHHDDDDKSLSLEALFVKKNKKTIANSN